MRIRKTLLNNDAEPIMVIMFILMVVGTINVFSSSYVKATLENGTPYFFLIRHCVFLIVGLVCFCIIRRIDYMRWRSFIVVALFLTIAALIAVFFVGYEVNGSRRWIPLPVVGAFQPAEFAKLIAIMLAAAVLSYRVKRKQKATIFNLQYGLIALMAGLTEKEPDMGTAAIIMGIPIIMAFVAGLSKKEKSILGTLLLVGIPFFVATQSYRLERVKIMFDPWADAQNKGYQMVQSLCTIGSGGFFGMGLGDGVSKYAYLPEGHTDFAFAIFCQEHGFIGALFVFALMALLIIFCLRIANRANEEFGQLLAMGIMILIAGQGIANMAMVGGILPVVGVPMPFISYGGSSLVVTMIAMGLLLSICDHSEKNKTETDKAMSDAAKKEVKATAEKDNKKLHLVK